MLSAVQFLPAQRHEAPDLAQVMASALMNDPISAHLLPGARSRAFTLPRLHELHLTSLLLPHGVVDVAAVHERTVGVVAWLPPGVNRAGWDVLRQVPRSLALGGVALHRLFDGGLRIHRARPSTPNWALVTVAVLPDCQGQGIGTALLQRRIEELDRLGESAYVEASAETNARLFAGLGFQEMERVPLGWRAPSVVPMYRPGIL